MIFRAIPVAVGQGIRDLQHTLSTSDMNIETLQRATKIQERIKFCREQIKHAEYTQADHVVPREMGYGFNGLPPNERMVIPETLWRVVGKLVLAEYQQELNALEIEFQNL